MMANESRPARLAILIDADNASPKIADSLFAHVANLGDTSVRRIYGDFSGTQAKGWATARVKHAIVPQQQFANVPGKNATDFALVIDAMDLLHAGGLDGFCIVSSDSDFTRLATRIREHGLKVFGFGRKETAASFRQACREFVDTDTLMPKPAAKPAKASQALKAPVELVKDAPPAVLKPTPPVHAPVADAERLILRALGEAGAGGKWIAIATVISEVRKLDPAFKPQSYGSSLFSELVDRTSCLEGNDEDGRCTQIRMNLSKKPKPIKKTALSVVPELAAS
jgi:hypothetical protein